MEYPMGNQTPVANITVSSTDTTDSNGASTGLILYIVLVFVPIGIISIIGNSIVVFTIYLYPSLQVVRNYYIASLAVADFLTGAIAMPGTISHYIFIRKDLSNASLTDAVTLYTMPLYLFSWASIHNLLLITWDRYSALTEPLTYLKNSTKRRAFVCIAIAWTISFIPIIIPFFWGLENGAIQTEAHMIRNYICSGYFTIILTIMVKLHLSTYKIARKREREIPGMMVLMRQRPRQGSEIAVELQLKSFKTISLVLVVFVTCLTPITVHTYVEYIWDVNIPWIVWVTEAVVFASSMVNPLIYACRRQDFREAFKRTFGCKLKYRPPKTLAITEV